MTAPRCETCNAEGAALTEHGVLCGGCQLEADQKADGEPRFDEGDDEVGFDPYLGGYSDDC